LIDQHLDLELTSFGRLKGYDKLEFVAKGCTFKDGELQQVAARFNFSERNI
jgi:hypothetical protein